MKNKLYISIDRITQGHPFIKFKFWLVRKWAERRGINGVIFDNRNGVHLDYGRRTEFLRTVNNCNELNFIREQIECKDIYVNFKKNMLICR